MGTVLRTVQQYCSLNLNDREKQNLNPCANKFKGRVVTSVALCLGLILCCAYLGCPYIFFWWHNASGVILYQPTTLLNFNTIIATPICFESGSIPLRVLDAVFNVASVLKVASEIRFIISISLHKSGTKILSRGFSSLEIELITVLGVV